MAAIARDEKAVELARKRFYPNITLGFTYMDMEKTNAVTPKTASGSPNVGLFVAFNLPVHHAKYQAGVLEAKERARADGKLYEGPRRDETFSEIQDFMVQAKVQENVLSLLRDSIEPLHPATPRVWAIRLRQSPVSITLTVLSALRRCSRCSSRSPRSQPPGQGPGGARAQQSEGTSTKSRRRFRHHQPPNLQLKLDFETAKPAGRAPAWLKHRVVATSQPRRH